MNHSSNYSAVTLYVPVSAIDEAHLNNIIDLLEFIRHCKFDPESIDRMWGATCDEVTRSFLSTFDRAASVESIYLDEPWMLIINMKPVEVSL